MRLQVRLRETPLGWTGSSSPGSWASSEASAQTPWTPCQTGTMCWTPCTLLAVHLTHLSRWAEDLIIYSSGLFKFVQCSDAYATGGQAAMQMSSYC